MITMYGITNCNTIKKARVWLEENGVEYTFHDYKKLGIDEEHLQVWCDTFGWEKVLNRAGMMWRKTPQEVKDKVVDTQTAIEFMITTPNAIKRPIIEYSDELLLGFTEEKYSILLK